MLSSEKNKYDQWELASNIVRLGFPIIVSGVSLCLLEIIN